MNDAELPAMRQLIHSRLTDMNAEDDLGATGQRTVELEQQAVGRLSRMDALQQQAMAQATPRRRAAQRARIAAALVRIDEEEYGFCTDCGDDIAKARLDHDPALPLCLSCARG